MAGRSPARSRPWPKGYSSSSSVGGCTRSPRALGPAARRSRHHAGERGAGEQSRDPGSEPRPRHQRTLTGVPTRISRARRRMSRLVMPDASGRHLVPESGPGGWCHGCRRSRLRASRSPRPSARWCRTPPARRTGSVPVQQVADVELAARRRRRRRTDAHRRLGTRAGRHAAGWLSADPGRRRAGFEPAYIRQERVRGIQPRTSSGDPAARRAPTAAPPRRSASPSTSTMFVVPSGVRAGTPGGHGGRRRSHAGGRRGDHGRPVGRRARPERNVLRRERRAGRRGKRRLSRATARRRRRSSTTATAATIRRPASARAAPNPLRRVGLMALTPYT